MSVAARWVQLWDRREPATALALVRVCVGLVMLWDFVTVAQLGLVGALWAPIEDGGIGPSNRLASPSPLLAWIGPAPQTVRLLFGLCCASAATLCVGLFSRTSALLLAIGSAQLALLSPEADRGIDTLMRNALLLLACSGAGRTLSLDCRIRQGRFTSDAPITAWPRYLLVVQLALLYFAAGMLKQSPPWTSLDGYSALYITLNHPHYASFSLPAEQLARVYPLLQAATFLTIWFERCAIFMPLLLWLRTGCKRPGRIRRLVNRARLLELWVALGIVFHLGLALSLQLGMFPWGCLALYPALASPTSAHALATRWIARVRHPRRRHAGSGGTPASS